jgi:hypothetical protein
VKKLFLITVLAFGAFSMLAFSPGDTISVDKIKLNVIIINLRTNLQKRNYGMSHQKKFSKRDITFVYPEKVSRLQPFDLIIKWKKKSIYIFEINPETYTIGKTFDLR